MDEAYDAFRTDFARKMHRLRAEFKYSLPIAVAEHDPRSVKPPYEFLSDTSLPRGEKIRLLEAVADATKASPNQLFHYAIDIRKVVQPQEPINAYFGLLRELLGEVVCFAQDAEKNDIDTQSEQIQIDSYKLEVSTAEAITRALIERSLGQIPGKSS